MDWTGAGGHMPISVTDYPKEIIQPRREVMEALCLGLPRTGTLSLTLALRQLGIRTYDMTECARDNANGSTKRWLEGVEANYLNGTGRKIKYRRDLDDLLWRYNAVAGMPAAALFPDELVSAYPNAKVILTETSADAWVKSMDKSYYSIIDPSSWGIVQKIDMDYSQVFVPLLRCALRVWTNNDEADREALKAHYTKHNAHIREIVPAKKLLVFDPKQGWEPLCKFLDKPIPKTQFPMIDEDEMVTNLHTKVFLKMRMQEGLKQVGKKLVPVLVLMFLAYLLLRAPRVG